ncbi:MAG: trypsin-like peptidase domain-containing protein, partial [Planctomycetota bacterium]
MSHRQLACSLALLLGAGAVAPLATARWANAQRPAAAPRDPAPQGAYRPASSLTLASPAERQFTPDELATIRVYEVANRSVVNITTSTMEYDRFFMVQSRGEGSGSGSVLDKQGRILTNQHVIEDARSIQVTLASGDSYDARVVGGDKEFDIAVLQIDAPPEKLTPIELGRSDNLRVGQKAFAVGNPFGLTGTLSTGVVSSLNRSLPSRVRDREISGLIQTDAAMNPGNSGGPLLDSGARMIGMSVAIASRVGQNSGVGFAIPVDRVKRFLPELIQYGKIRRAYHGIVTLMETDGGLKIARLSRGGPADRAGLRGFRVVRTERRQGAFIYTDTKIDRDYADTIMAIDGQPVSDHNEFVSIMDRHKPGDTV